MNSENRAKIREALRGCQKFISSLNTGGEDERMLEPIEKEKQG